VCETSQYPQLNQQGSSPIVLGYLHKFQVAYWFYKPSQAVSASFIYHCASEKAPTIYTADEEQFKKLETHNLTIINPTTTTF